jgi:hypothetical protein
MFDYKNILDALFEKVERMRTERPTAGTRYRLMGLAADVTETTEMMTQEVLERVTKEVVLDADTDIDYTETGERVQAMVLTAPNDDLQEATQAVNDALGVLSDVLTQIASQLERRHKDEAYARLYDQEKRRYLSSGTPRRVRQTFEDWLYDVCNGSPCMDDINAYVTEKLVHMFEKGVFDSKVEHIQRATRYPAEFDFSLLDDDHKLKKSIHKHYSELRKLVDYCDGFLVVNPVKVGRHFYTNRKEENARGHRNAFLKYMHKITLAQEERRKLLEAEATRKEDSENVLNYFAPAKNLKVLLTEEWFGMLTADEKRFTTKWLHGFVDALMASEWRDQIASDWTVADKRLGLKCMIIGLLKDAGVIRGSYNSIAKLLDMDNENPATLAKYMGMGKKQPYAEWIADYVKG